MNIYLVSRTNPCGYDEYELMIVYAKDKEDAINLTIEFMEKTYTSGVEMWDTKPNLTVKLLGRAVPNANREIIFASFRAG